MNIKLRLAKEKDIHKVNEHYNNIGFKESVFSDEMIVIAEQENHTVGLGRLQNIDGYSAELGGIYVLPEYRGKGLARDIVNHLLELSDEYDTVYCIPFAHLEEFYKGFGFEIVVERTEIPLRVKEKLDWCNCQYDMKTILLKIDNK